ncbi:MAG: hypothetical protein HC929_06425 [Leptolyngbyaceae cyanobacterium SM2_5_2]|nr:hypothetical protein [Leptolyngbyaceae cyanobacterium SM2_5_2]
MAASSRPFQSQTVAHGLAGYRWFARSAERWLRQGRMALLWGLQVALYPAYLGFQSVRTLSRRLQATQPWSRVTAWLTGQPPQALPNGADTPIRALLSITQPQIVRRPGGLRFVDRYGQFLRQSRAESVLTNGQWHLLPLQGAVRGVASDLATRKLVLVTADNALFAGLTADQQDRLHRALVLLLAEYAAMERRQWQQRQLKSSALPLPAAEATQWLPVQWLHRLMGWMQMSPLAITTNLFGEADTASKALPATPTNLPQPFPMAGLMRSQWENGTSSLAQSHPVSIPAGTNTMVALPQAWVTAVEDAKVVLTGQTASTVTPPVAHRLDNLNLPGTLATEPAPRALEAVNAIEARATLVNYVDHPLVLVLRWLDTFIYAAEAWLKQVWQWLLRHF